MEVFVELACLDLEGVLVPEIWIEFSKATGIEELKATTRDIPDYDVLMKQRLAILKQHKLGLKEIQAVIATLKPLDGAVEFVDYIRLSEIPYNELHNQGYISIGCEPCTRPVLPGQHEREGRWWWEEATKKECGLHADNLIK